MRSRAPELITLLLLLGVVLFPPWLIFLGAPEGVGVYDTEWAFIFTGPSEESDEGRVDIALLVFELVVVGAIYYLLKKILEQPK